VSLDSFNPPPLTRDYTRRERGSRRSGGPPDDSTRSSYYLYAGQVFSSKTPTSVTTILGSCVSVCLWDPRLGIGGINHFLMPDWTGRGRMSPRFGDVAIASLIESLTTLGCKLDNLTAKVFGGASVMGSPNKNDSLGDRNVRLARVLLDEEGIRIVGGDTGGCAGRKLIYQTDDASSWVKRL